MKEIVCRVCSNHCVLSVGEDQGGLITVTGNKCHRGEQFGRDEYLGERQVVRHLVATQFEEVPAVYVRTSHEVPKEFLFKLIRYLKKMRISEPLPKGTVLESNPLGIPVDLVLDSEELEVLL